MFMKKIFLILSIFISFLIIYKFGYDRWIGYSQIPDNGIFDERNYALQGISLRKNGVPIGWSDLGIYSNIPKEVEIITMKDLGINVNNITPKLQNIKALYKPVISVNEFDYGFGTRHVRFVQPFLDHPPLGGLIYSLGLPKDVNNFADIRPYDYRTPALYLAVITSVLIFLLAYQVFKNPFVSLLSVIVYNSVPTYLLASRYALLENVVAPISLLSLNFLIPAVKGIKKNKNSTILLLISGITAGFIFLAKESGVGFILAEILLLIYYKVPKKKSFWFLSGVSLPIILYLTWGFWFFGDFFFKVMLANSQRGFIGSLNFIKIFSNLGFKPFSLDGWWIFGFLSVILLFFGDRKKFAPILIPFICELFVILFLSGINYPWYYFALIPYLSVAAGYILWKVIYEPDAVLLPIFFLFPLSSSLYWGYTVRHGEPSNLLYRIILVIFTTASVIRLICPNKKYVRILWIIFSVLIIAGLVKLNHSSILYIIANWNKNIVPTFSVID